MNAHSEIRMSAQPTALNFQIGARTLMAVSRSLTRVPLSLDEALDGRLPQLPPLEREAHGYLVTSLPADRAEAMVYASGGMIAFVRQRYTRYFTDLTGGFDAWFEGLSGNTRSQLKRKAKKIAATTGGTLDVRRFRGPEEIERFHDVGRRIALRTYQERLLGAGLPDSPEFLSEMFAKAAADQVRAWLLYVEDEPAAYLYCPARGATLLYEYVGHDPAFNDLSPGAVLQIEAFRDLFAEGRFARFDFTEGEGQHKRQLATGGVACVDLLLLRPSLANRLTTAALGGFNRSVAAGKQAVNALGLERLARRLRRG